MDKIKVLIVEDDMITANDIAQRLEINGCEIIAITGNAMEAMEIVTRKKPDIALLDISLGKGKMDGIELAKRIIMETEMPIIFLTAFADDVTITRAMQTAPASYLVKPVNDKQLLVSLNLALNRFSIRKTESDHCFGKEKKPESDHFIMNNSFFIRKQERYWKTQLSKIQWIEADGNYATIVTAENKYTIISNLGTLLCQMNKNSRTIIRVHRSYAVNIEQIDSFDHIHVFIKDMKIPIGKSYREEFFNLIGYK